MEGADVVSDSEIDQIVEAVRPDLGAILREIEAEFQRFVIYPTEHEPVALALWIVHGHAIEAAEVTPYLHVTSPERRSGKSRTEEVANSLLPEAYRIIVPTAAAIYGLLDVEDGARPPALLFDEVDNYLMGGASASEAGQALIGVLNDGFYRGGTVPRVEFVGKRRTIRHFPTFGVKAFSGKAALPDTLADRCLPIRLRRRHRSEQISPFRRRDVIPKLSRVRDRIAEVVDEEMIARLTEAWPEIPSELEDRQADLWEPLLAIADEAGGEWPSRARSAAVAIHADGETVAETAGVAMLRDCARIFAEAGVEKLPTRDLANRLADLDEASGPWAEEWSRLIVAANWKAIGWRIAAYLRPYGIRSTKIKLPDGSTAMGYRVAEFLDPIERYAFPAKRDGTTEPNLANPADDVRGSEVPFSPRVGWGESLGGTLTPEEEEERLRLVVETLNASLTDEV